MVLRKGATVGEEQLPAVGVDCALVACGDYDEATCQPNILMSTLVNAEIRKCGLGHMSCVPDVLNRSLNRRAWPRKVDVMASVVSSRFNGFAAADALSPATIVAARSADSATVFAAAIAAVCPIGTVDFAAHGSALMSNLASALRFGSVHATLGGATHAWGASLIAADNM